MFQGNKGSPNLDKTWLTLTIAVVIVVAVCLAILFTLVFVDFSKIFQTHKDEKKPITKQELNNGSFRAKDIDEPWFSDEEAISLDDNNNLILKDVTNNASTVLVPTKTMSLKEGQSYSVSPDGKYVLFEEVLTRLYRYSRTSHYTVYDIEEERDFSLVPEDKYLDLQLAIWGKKGSQLVFVYENNVYYIQSINGKTVEDSIQITKTGVRDIVYNGVADWLNEEEILYTDKALWFSESGNYLSFMTFNDAEVDEYPLTLYLNAQSNDDRAPSIKNIRYPKPGRPNPTITLNTVNLNKVEELKIVSPPEEFWDIDHYITYPRWINDSTMLVTWTNRVQNYSEISYCTYDTQWRCQKHTEQKTNGRGWVYAGAIPHVIGDKFYIILPVDQGPKGYFHHLVQISLTSKVRKMLTKGLYDVMKILKVDIDNDIVYFQTTKEDKPGESHVMSYSEKEGIRQINPNDDQCLYNVAYFNKKATHFQLRCLGPGMPKTDLWTTENGSSYVSNLANNEKLETKLKDYALPKIKDLKISLEDDEFHAWVRLYMPYALDESGSKKYPMLIDVYGAPEFQTITEEWGLGERAYRIDQMNIIYCYIDARGSGNRGETYMHTLFKRLGTVEVEDRIYVVKKLIEKFSFIDATRICVNGWSYGGYLSAMMLAESDIFKCGISVAPVTNWLYYDTAYTERYMHMPTVEDNYDQYKNSSLLRRAKQLKGKQFLLMHGSFDDNVHILHSMLMIRALVNEGVLFQFQAYTDDSHSMNNGYTHLISTMDRFIDFCFKKRRKRSSAHALTDIIGDFKGGVFLNLNTTT